PTNCQTIRQGQGREKSPATIFNLNAPIRVAFQSFSLFDFVKSAASIEDGDQWHTDFKKLPRRGFGDFYFGNRLVEP
ncbi:MAG TPA: hypothetical protein VEQ35_01400, partial [Beijerinckia sp.]|nr:hypothetical protein [Beijerinckia sp.]